MICLILFDIDMCDEDCGNSMFGFEGKCYGMVMLLLCSVYDFVEGKLDELENGMLQDCVLFCKCEDV